MNEKINENHFNDQYNYDINKLKKENSDYKSDNETLLLEIKQLNQKLEKFKNINKNNRSEINAKDLFNENLFLKKKYNLVKSKLKEQRNSKISNKRNYQQNPESSDVQIQHLKNMVSRLQGDILSLIHI